MRLASIRRLPTLLFFIACGAVLSMCRTPGANKGATVPSVPSVRLVFASTVAGAMEPCGCRKDMLGGIDHAAALLDSTRSQAPNRLVFASGPLLFLDPELDESRTDQDLWKAESIANSLAAIELRGWAPGVNDFAAGAETLQQLANASGANMLAANLSSESLPAFAATGLYDAGPFKVGVAGIAAAPSSLTASGSVVGIDRKQALTIAAKSLREQGADILVALIAAPRGEALRLAEQVSDFAVIALGKPENHGEENEAAAPPTLIGKTLVVQSPNHLQGLAAVDLYVLDGRLQFEDGMGLAKAERVQALERRVEATSKRLDSWQRTAKPTAAQVKERQKDLERLRESLAVLQAEKPPAIDKSFFRYSVQTVDESAGTNRQVAERMTQYYRKVNEHNRVAFKDRKPKPVAEGEAHYAGQQECADCHGEADEFWKTTQHATAYATLADDFKQFNLDCVGCHVTGYEKPGGSTVTFVENLKDVQCEACHGPGSRHAENSDTADLIVLTPDKSVCRGCHHTPHVADDWDVDDAWQKIIGPGHGVAKTPANRTTKKPATAG